MRYTNIIVLTFTGIFLTSCTKNKISANPVTPGESLYNLSLSTDKAVYNPGENVLFKINEVPAGCTIRYRHLGTILKEEPLSASNWNWQLPSQNYYGYLVEIYKKTRTEEKPLAAIGVDVSSDGIHFPRNGFVSSYGQLSDDYMSTVMNNLNRFHINVVQFQDWEYKHHLPLAGTVANPLIKWNDIANRNNTMATVKQYINLAHGYNMKTLSYNLIYGALNDAAEDGVSDQWYMYQDQQHITKDIFTLPRPPFKSDIYFLDPSNTGWQNYISGKTEDAYKVYNFDGYQVDQVGNRNKNLYNYSGASINLEATFKSFLEAMKSKMPGKKLVMNAVNQYGQQLSIAQSPVDFLYTEVWAPNEEYKELATTIQNNDSWSNSLKKSVLCAYMNYNVADKPGFFNTPGVLLTDAVIFSFGGSHLELGEHMLGKEYFPNSNLQMKDDLKNAMINYYDFLVAYENLLRDGGTFNSVSLNCTNGKMSTGVWPPQTEKVSVQGKTVGNSQVFHLINFANAAHFQWRDTNENQTIPNTISGANLEASISHPVTNVWVASPDINFGVSQIIPFTQNGNIVRFTLPQLRYWDMVVIE
ncbi:MAG: glycoside hydrolase family 66 protein [Ginsengibacter sp.]